MKNYLIKYRVPVLFGSALVLFVMGLVLMENIMTKINDSAASPVATVPRDQDAIASPTGAQDLLEETLIAPAGEDVSVVRYFYVAGSDTTRQKASMDYFEGVYRPSLGIDYSKDGDTFEVMASLSGTVKDIKTDPLFGRCVSLECSNGITLIYQSMSDIKVSQGDAISQGSVIGSSGENVYEAELGNHLHFALEKDGRPLDASTYFNQKVAEIK